MSNRMNKLLKTVYQLCAAISILIFYKIILVNLYILLFPQRQRKTWGAALRQPPLYIFLIYTVSPQASA